MTLLAIEPAVADDAAGTASISDLWVRNGEGDRAVGGRRPQRIVGVWLISVGAFGGELADATFADVTVRSGGSAVEV
ncbi:MAG TPA: hypothetical protein VMT85_21545, partial [Thermoanaerobaculia bacterium]|nr:hypothetical protein [Thermoanaerobaculia bacterium]